MRLWSLKDGAVSVLNGHGAAVRRVAFSGDGKRLVTVSEDRTARVWDVASKEDLRTLHGDEGGFGVAALNPSGDRVLTAGTGKDFTVRLWDTATGRELHRWQESHGTVLGLAFSPDGQTAASWGADGSVRLRKSAGPLRSRVRCRLRLRGARLDFTGLLERRRRADGHRAPQRPDRSLGQPAAAHRF